MASFTVRGSRNGSKVHITWTDGVLSGDPPTADLILVEAELAVLHDSDAHSWARVVDPHGELSGDPLQDAGSTWRLIASVLDTVQSGEGDLPEEAAAILGVPHRD